MVEVIPWVLSGAVLAGLAWYNLTGAARATRAEARATRKVVRTHYRVHEGAGALGEAAEADAAFAPEAVARSVDRFVALADAIWRRRSVALERSGTHCVHDWAVALSAAEGNVARVLSGPGIGVLDVVNRSDVDEDRVAVRVRLRLLMRRRNWIERRIIHSDTRWTLVREGDTWFPIEIEDYVGDPSVARRPFIAQPSDDVERLREASFAELAAADMPVKAGLGELLIPGTVPYSALLELSVLDGRYAPALLEASLQHLLEVWQTATSGSQQPLRSVAAEAAVDELLYAADGSRRLPIVARDMRLSQWFLAQFDRDATPATVLVNLTVEGISYRIRPNSTVHPADTMNPRERKLWWRLALAEHGPCQWRLINADAALTA